MTVYIEFVILSNALVTFAAAHIAERWLRFRLPRIRKVFGIAIGGLLPLIYPFIDKDIILSVLFRLFASVAITLTMYLGKNYWVRALTFVAATGVMMGFAAAFCYALGGEMTANKVYIYMPCICGVPVAIVALANKLAQAASERRDLGGKIYRVRIVVDGNEFELHAFYDTGNIAHDKQNIPIVFVRSEVANDMAKYSHETLNICGVGGNSVIRLVRPDNFRLYLADKSHIDKDVTIGIVSGITAAFDAILPACIFD